MFVRVLTILSSCFLSGCALSGFLPDWSSADAAGPEPAYRFIIANRLKEVLGSENPTDTLQISEVKRIDSIKGASWRACVRAQRFPLPPRYYAVFIQMDQIVDTRLSVLIDQCELQSYSVFDWSNDRNKPPVRQGGRSGYLRP